MKKLGKIKLNQFSKDELERRKMNALKGGCGCRAGCSCSGPANAGGSIDACNHVLDDIASRYESY
ncbi:TIGR04149 family rSAM-modified RiPP [Parabacteroides sp. AM08-6]|uniref:TIGR04149 family rSAM-modified RiPP n=1 Tax=Parabacteroides sp. AM08-6 TaxID=2292053 RepID=UPI000EFF951D|nr:TIGR04149 family rSAM-modified RiPP [Parabacteroides sp. AM08-6]RHJ85305.1 rSAM-modified peptide [Parabacteroides sp. AM08-6]